MDVDLPSVKPASATHRRAKAMVSERRASSLPPKNPRPITPTVGYVYDSRMMGHSCISGHPEQPERIKRIHDAFRDAGLIAKMKKLAIREAERDEVLLVHSETLWDKVMAIGDMTTQDIVDSEQYYQELSLYVSQSTPEAARLSCGGVIEAAAAIARGEVEKAFAIVRPPGHHSEPDEHMGFCFFNNVAVAIKVIQTWSPFKKIMILDWDVHHGNGTQKAFYDDPNVLYVSLHRYENGTYYPNGPFGSLLSVGDGPGVGYSVNIPWPSKGMGDADYIYAFQRIVMPIAMEFAPDLVIISAGFDAAKGDDLGECEVTPAGYAHMTHMLSGLAGGKMLVALEGGYCLDAISTSATAVARILVGEAPPELPSMVASDIATETVYQVAVEQSKYWRCMNPKAVEPQEELQELAVSIPELLKAHRQNYLFKAHGMLQVPFVNQELTDRFFSQVTCTPDIMDNDTMVVFVHEFGNMRIELESVLMCNPHEEHSYMVDFSKQLIESVVGAGHALLDVNLFPKPVTQQTRRRHRDGVKEDWSMDVMTYLWDNYIQLTSARKVALIGHGPGCAGIIDLLQNRAANCIQHVQAVVQVVGSYTVPGVPRDLPELSKWYSTHSMVVLPKTHRAIQDQQKFTKRHGKLVISEETKPIMLITRHLRTIMHFVQKRLGKPEPADKENAENQVNGA
ncbi:histone deacetylase clr3 [Phanerochaete sordida]|uniref:histone deacetylase n=1 Tax=Phanerochaete sordida TaxID=48140 RepID=A0A9P3GL05_9APHY|nr:histone deacetylase clr3 [Phanerochaete sordida]